MKTEKMVNEFISTLSHEIRTPLTSIKGFTQTLLGSWDSLSDEQKKKFLGIISEQSQRLINLVENVLNVAKLEGGDELVLREIDPLKIAKNTLDMMKINHKERTFKLESQEGAPLVLADYDKLQQVLVNVLDNACKYSKGTIFVRVLKDGTIEVEDEGEGISEGDIENIFNKFYRAQNLLTSSAQGSGLGLYIAKSLMEKMGGYIKVQSKKGGGETKFGICLSPAEPEKLTKRVRG